MPNWCMQEVYLHGETSMVTHPLVRGTEEATVFVVSFPDNC